MDIRSLRYFLSVISEGGVGAAARKHFVSQPAISAQLRRLEEEVGEPLLERAGRHVRPTSAGNLLALHAQDVVRRMDLAESAMAALRTLESGTLRLGSIDAASIYVLPDVYREFHERYPGIALQVTVTDTRQLIRALRSGEVEMVTATLPTGDDSLETLPIYRERLVPVARPDHLLARKRRVTLPEIVAAGVITYTSGSTTRRLIDDVFDQAGHELRPTMEISSPEAMKELAQAGLGVSILPRPVVTAAVDAGALVVLPVAKWRFERVIGVVFRDADGLSPAAREFLTMVRARFETARA